MVNGSEKRGCSNYKGFEVLLCINVPGENGIIHSPRGAAVKVKNI